MLTFRERVAAWGYLLPWCKGVEFCSFVPKEKEGLV